MSSPASKEFIETAPHLVVVVATACVADLAVTNELRYSYRSACVGAIRAALRAGR